jgi:tRNA pseudouridine32 synthase/23S rRNA pseudouridine746 synthase
MDTSGLLMFARGLPAQRLVSRAFEQRQVGKTYIAIVAGEPANDAGEIDLPLRADWPNRPRQMVDAEAGKPSLTRWQVLQRLGDRSRLALHPLTGRSHQLRVHLAAIGHPILGDRLYAPTETFAAAARLMLHASALALDHPEHGQPIRFRSEPPF